MSSKILLLGKNGQVGWELQRALAPLGHVTALDRSGADGLCGDLADLEGIAGAVRQLKPNVIVNAAAHTAVDKAESEPELANRLNAEAPAVLAREAAALGATLVHYSTDYVFDGTGQVPWLEDHPTGPLSVYGQGKLAGEQAIRESGCSHLIFRTSWVYAARGGNFAKTMLRLGAERERLTVIDDQWGAPTGADLIADVTAHAIRHLRSRPSDAGTYHLAASGFTTWFSYAKHVFDTARSVAPSRELAVKDIVPVATEAFPLPAPRPRNSRLNTQRLQSTFDLVLPPWQQGLERMLAEIL
ncbi:dTDP-4-dehydrorhamnose reductase [Ottowia thiooxydans]|uniref:dTDP-4-dehydrorhamnose reductase n=1 Tax=Ottowia thiooxydans TaxID=219182 RepID=A0ABV2QBC3_9BURK